jgi:hypothetical protein
MFMTVIVRSAFLLMACALPEIPDVVVTSDDVVITRTCRIVIPSDTLIEDRNGNGVIQIGASHIQVTFAQGAVLRGGIQRDTNRLDQNPGPALGWQCDVIYGQRTYPNRSAHRVVSHSGKPMNQIGARIDSIQNSKPLVPSAQKQLRHERTI